MPLSNPTSEAPFQLNKGQALLMSVYNHVLLYDKTWIVVKLNLEALGRVSVRRDCSV